MPNIQQTYFTFIPAIATKWIYENGHEFGRRNLQLYPVFRILQSSYNSCNGLETFLLIKVTSHRSNFKPIPLNAKTVRNDMIFIM